MSDHFVVIRGELVEAPRLRLGWLAGVSLGLFIIVVGVAIARLGGWL